MVMICFSVFIAKHLDYATWLHFTVHWFCLKVKNIKTMTKGWVIVSTLCFSRTKIFDSEESRLLITTNISFFSYSKASTVFLGHLNDCNTKHFFPFFFLVKETMHFIICTFWDVILYGFKNNLIILNPFIVCSLVEPFRSTNSQSLH